MKLSMSMIAWYVKQYQPQSKINQDEMIIEGIRFLSEEPTDMLAQYVFIGDASHYFSDDKYHSCYILVQGKNYLLFQNIEYEVLLNRLLSSFDFFNRWERHLLEAVSEGCSIQELLAIAYPVLGNPLLVGDYTFNHFVFYPASYGGPDPYWSYIYEHGDPHPMVFEKNYFDTAGTYVRELSEKPQLIKNVYEGGSPVLMLDIRQDNETVSTLAILQENSALTQLNLQLAPLLSKYLLLTEEFVSSHAVIRSGVRTFQAFLDGMMIRDSYGENSVQRLKGCGLQDMFYLLIIQHCTRRDHLFFTSLLKKLQNSPFFITPVLQNEQLVTLFNASSHPAPLEQILQELTASTHLQIAVSLVSTDPFSIPLCYQQAQFTMSKVGNVPGVYLCQDVAFDYLINECRQLSFTKALLHPALQILLQYDSQNQTELYNSLRMFLEFNLDILKTAQYLHIHRNTLKYRIRRIVELTGLDLADQQDVDYVRLSFWLANDRAAQ